MSERKREVLHGVTPVEEALRARRRALHRLWIKRDADSERHEAVLELAREAGVETVEAHPDELHRRAKTRTHQGLVLSCGPLPLLAFRDLLQRPHDDRAVLLALDRIEDPQNLGGLVRTAAFLGAEAILLHRGHRAPLTATVSKASAGCLEWFDVAESGNLADALQRLSRSGWHIVGSALEEGASDASRLQAHGPTVLVMGNEGEGMRTLTRKRCDELVFIERRGRAESLNVTVAAGVLLDRLLGSA